MNQNAGTVPFVYGDLVSITMPGPVFWFEDKSGLIRGVKLVTEGNTAKLSVGDDEILIRRTGADSGLRPGSKTPLPGSIQAPTFPASPRAT